MPKFTFISEDLDLNGYLTGSKTTKEFTCESLSDVIGEFEMFIRGTGYSFDGLINFIENDTDETKPHSDIQYPTNHYSNIK